MHTTQERAADTECARRAHDSFDIFRHLVRHPHIVHLRPEECGGDLTEISPRFLSSSVHACLRSEPRLPQPGGLVIAPAHHIDALRGVPHVEAEHRLVVARERLQALARSTVPQADLT